MAIQIIGIPSLRIMSSDALRQMASAVIEPYFVLYDDSVKLSFGRGSTDRMVQVASDTSAQMLYSDFMDDMESGKKVPHPLIDCQKGSVRDDFDFGKAVLLERESFLSLASEVPDGLEYGAMYWLRLHLERIVHLSECLYSSAPDDTRTSGERQFDYVDVRNRDVQLELEGVFTAFLRETGAFLEPVFETPSDYSGEDFPVRASVVIPVLNRARTIADAVRSALSQKTDFPFNVIVVDNHSTDGTSELLAGIAAEDTRLVHLIPEDDTLGIGGCWNFALNSGFCGLYAVQLDSDDVYSGEDTLRRIVDTFVTQHCAAVVGSYRMTDFEMNTIPPGIIDHKEWTDANGRNNALRINGFGAPRAFLTPVARELAFPDVSYGEDYAMMLRISRKYRIARIWEPVYNCRRWGGNSDADLDQEKLNRFYHYKDSIRTMELEARRKL